MEQFQRAQEYERCVCCRKSISKQDEIAQSYTILQCGHMTHRICLEDVVKRATKGQGEMACPSCKDRISQLEIQAIFGEEFA